MFAEDRFVETGFSFSNDVPAPPKQRRGNAISKSARQDAGPQWPARALPDRNISAGGLMAHVYSRSFPARAWRSAQDNNDRRHHLDARRQCQDQFDEPVDVAELLANPPLLDNGWRPRMPGSRSTAGRRSAPARRPSASAPRHRQAGSR
jgi:hypothetical protein